MIRIGDPAAPYRVFVRARAHPWESGSNWVAQGPTASSSLMSFMIALLA